MGNGAFTHFLLEGVNGKADGDKNGVVTVQEAYEYVYNMTKDRTDGAQHPCFEGSLTGSFPMSFLHPPAPMLEIVTRPARAELYIREGSRFTLLKTSDEKGLAQVNKLPLGKPIIMMVNKAGWKEKILDPFVFSPEKMTIKMPPIVLDPSLGFLVVRTNAPQATVSIGARKVGVTGDEGLLIVESVQVGLSHELQLAAHGYKNKTFTVTIPAIYEGKVYKTPLLLLEQEPKKSASLEQRTSGAEKPASPSLPKQRDPERTKEAEAAKLLQTKFLQAVKAGKPKDVRALLEKKVILDAKDHLGWTPLMHAVSADSEGIAKLLLAKGANPNVGDNLGWTPLMVAASSGYEGMVKLLLAKGANKAASNLYGETAGTKAAAAGHESIVALLGAPRRNQEADEDPADPEPPISSSQQPKEHPVVVKRHETELFKAAKNGDEGAVIKLLASDVNVDADDELGWSPLMYAAAGGHLAIAKLLLGKRCRVNAADRFGWTALMLAAANGHPNIVRLLLDKGADKDARNVYGETAAMKAKVSGNHQVMRLMGVSIPADNRVTQRPTTPRPSRKAKEAGQPKEKKSEEDDEWLDTGMPELDESIIPQVDHARQNRTN